MTAQKSTASREGGCLCGHIRYAIAWPPKILVTCSCTDCQKQSGGAVSVVAAVDRGALQQSGTCKTYTGVGSSGHPVYRMFCPECGSAVFTETDKARQEGLIFVKAGTLDHTQDLNPTIHCWTASAQKWLSFPEGDTIMQHQEGLR